MPDPATRRRGSCFLEAGSSGRRRHGLIRQGLHMSRLFVLRHGIAVPRGSAEVSDEDRPLTPKGPRRMRQIGRGLRRLGIELDAIVASPLPRAWETAEIIAHALAMPDRLEASEMLRDDRNSTSIREWIH